MSKEKLTNQLKNAYKQLEEFKNKGRPNTIEDNNVDYDNCNIYAMRQKIFDLEAKLAESEEENETFRKALQGEVFINYEIPMENERLKQQLAEKEKEIEKITRIVAYRDDVDRSTTINGVKFTNEQIITLQNIDYFADKHNQDKISFAVEQLEKLKKQARYFLVENKEGLTGFYVDVEVIDNQIKELKGEENV